MQSNRGAQHETESDGELLERVRNGDVEAYGELWQRHRFAAEAVARNLTRRQDPEDLVAEAFAKVLQAIQRGAGPAFAFRPYVYTVMKSIAMQSPDQSSVQLEDELAAEAAADTPWEDTSFDMVAVRNAYSALDERDQAVLWYSEVERLKPREIAKLFGLSANHISALRVRAVKSLRSGWINAHLSVREPEPECGYVLDRLTRYHSGKLRNSTRARLDAHLTACESCDSASGEVRALNSQLASRLAAVVLGVSLAETLRQSLLQSSASKAAAATLAPAVGLQKAASVSAVLALTGGLVAFTAGAVLIPPPEAAIASGMSHEVQPTSEDSRTENQTSEKTPSADPTTVPDEQPSTEEPQQTSGPTEGPAQTTPPPETTTPPPETTTPPPPPPTEDVVGVLCMQPDGALVGNSSAAGMVEVRAYPPNSYSTRYAQVPGVQPGVAWATPPLGIDVSTAALLSAHSFEARLVWGESTTEWRAYAPGFC